MSTTRQPLTHECYALAVVIHSSWFENICGTWCDNARLSLFFGLLLVQSWVVIQGQDSSKMTRTLIGRYLSERFRAYKQAPLKFVTYLSDPVGTVCLLFMND